MKLLELVDFFEIPKDIKTKLLKINESFEFKINIENQNLDINTYDNFNILFENNSVKIHAKNYRSFLYALDDFISFHKNATNIDKKTNVLNRGYMLDISRGKIPNKRFMHELVIFLRKNKMNNLQIYIEPNFYKDELIWIKNFDKNYIYWLDNICKINGILLIPAIATFSHLYDLVKNNKSIQKLTCIPYVEREYFFADKMRHYTLDPTKNETFEISKKIINFALKNFSSKIINLGCDEPFDMQTDFYKQKHENYFEIYGNYIKKITDYVIEKKWIPQVWADVFVNNKLKNFFDINKNVVFMNWDYNPLTDISVISSIKNEYSQILCSSDGNFGYQYQNLQKGFLNQNTLLKYNNLFENVKGILLTHWGDWGHLNSIVHGLLVVKHLSRECYEFDNKLVEYENEEEIIYDSLVDNQLLLYRRVLSWYEWKLLWPEYEKYEEERNNVIKNISSYKLYISIVQTTAKTNWLIKNKNKIKWLDSYFKKIFFEELELFKQINIINNLLAILIQKNMYNINHTIYEIKIEEIKSKLDEFSLNVKNVFNKYYKYDGILILLRKYYEILSLIEKHNKFERVKNE